MDTSSPKRTPGSDRMEAVSAASATEQASTEGGGEERKPDSHDTSTKNGLRAASQPSEPRDPTEEEHLHNPVWNAIWNVIKRMWLAMSSSDDPLRALVEKWGKIDYVGKRYAYELSDALDRMQK